MNASGRARSAAEAEARREARDLQGILADYVTDRLRRLPPGLSPTRGLRPRHVPPELLNDPVVRGLLDDIRKAQERAAHLRRNPLPQPREMLEP